ncbi:sodium ion-translocating decarboxylase subunit beta, partial [Luoshenia tenuis]|uniref:sodium ion-translocating decarboxylase subunit beta n=1 Tax=Luoshenia tenuis TaxID=2763654 RepID=UPI003D92A9A9
MLDIDLGQTLMKFAQDTGFATLTWQQGVMLLVSCVLIYLAVVKQYEPLLLLPIAFGMLLVNLPMGGLMAEPTYYVAEDGTTQVQQVGGLLYYLYQGVKLGVYPPLIFLGIGAMTDFGPLIANPKSLLLGAAAQLGIFVAFIGALLLGFDVNVAASIGIIGGADGPTAIYVTSRLAPDYLGP